MNERLNLFKTVIPQWENLIKISFLSEKGKEDYLQLLKERTMVLDL
jgi:hypothetical protein